MRKDRSYDLVLEEEIGGSLANMSEANRLFKAEGGPQWRDHHKETHLRNVQLKKEGAERVRLVERERTLKNKGL